MKKRLDALVAIIISGAAMWMLEKAGYLAGAGLVWKCVLAGGIAGALALALRYIPWAGRAAEQDKK